ncbi:MAG: metallopeptidase family protein [Tepidisphaeraceae bacterium]
MPFDVSRERFAQLVERALADVPPVFVQYLEEISIEIRDRPTTRQLKSVGLRDDELLFGLYHGIARDERSVLHSGVMPDVIYIFQEDHEDACDSEDELVEQVRITVLHEIGHHFGMSEDDLDGLGYG